MKVDFSFVLLFLGSFVHLSLIASFSVCAWDQGLAYQVFVRFVTTHWQMNSCNICELGET